MADLPDLAGRAGWRAGKAGLGAGWWAGLGKVGVRVMGRVWVLLHWVE